MADIAWREKRNADGRVIPRCWLTDGGYTVAECRIPEIRYAISRPGGAQPFAYEGDPDRVVAAIAEDMARRADEDSDA